MNQWLKKRWVYHSLIWLGLFVFLLALELSNSGGLEQLPELAINLLFVFIPLISVTYLALFIKEKLFDHRRYVLFALAFVAVIFIGILIYEALALVDDSMRNSLTQNIINFSFLQLCAVGVQYFKRGIINQYLVQELRAKTAVSELNALKAQLNPHFLFNTLNNIYGINQIDSEKGSEMILELSDVMRYHLELSKEGMVKLGEEIKLLKSYIKLEQLRLRETCDVQVDLEQVDPNLSISPLLLIPFVENAFKHGTHPTRECFVHVKVSTTPAAISLTVKNSTIENRKVVRTNIGLQNIKRRLELLFPHRHQLTIQKNEEFHLVELSMVHG